MFNYLISVLNGFTCLKVIAYARRKYRRYRRKHNLEAPPSPDMSVTGAVKPRMTPEKDDVELSGVKEGTENPSMTPEEDDVELSDVKESAEKPGMTSEEVDVELGDVKETAENPGRHRPSNAVTIVTVDEDEDDTEDEDENEDKKSDETWRDIARALDRIFFWVFSALFVLSTIVIYGQAGRLSSLDKLKF